MADDLQKEATDAAKQGGKALSALVAVLTFLEKITVPLLMWLWQVAKNKQTEAEAKVAYYETKEHADDAKKTIDQQNSGKPSSRIIRDFLDGNGTNK